MSFSSYEKNVVAKSSVEAGPEETFYNEEGKEVVDKKIEKEQRNLENQKLYSAYKKTLSAKLEVCSRVNDQVQLPNQREVSFNSFEDVAKILEELTHHLLNEAGEIVSLREEFNSGFHTLNTKELNYDRKLAFFFHSSKFICYRYLSKYDDLRYYLMMTESESYGAKVKAKARNILNLILISWLNIRTYGQIEFVADYIISLKDTGVFNEKEIAKAEDILKRTKEEKRLFMISLDYESSQQDAMSLFNPIVDDLVIELGGVINSSGF